jgi:hypothetical protein
LQGFHTAHSSAQEIEEHQRNTAPLDSRGERLLGPSTHPPRPARRTSSFRVMRLLPFSVSAFFAGDSRALPAGPSRVSTLACRTSPAVALASSCWQRRRPPRLLRSTRVLPLRPPAPSARPRQVRRGRSRDHERCRVRMVEPDELPLCAKEVHALRAAHSSGEERLLGSGLPVNRADRSPVAENDRLRVRPVAEQPLAAVGVVDVGRQPQG